MSRTWLMALDIGGGGGRCALLEPESGEFVSAARPWRFPVTPGTGGLGADLDTDRVWSRIAEASREALDRAGARPEDVAGVAASAMRLGTVVLDRNRAPILAAPNRDARATAEGLRLAAEHGSLLQAAAGHWPTPIFPLARLLWLRERAPDALAGASAVLSLSDWLAFRLSGEIACEPSQASNTLLFDLDRGEWAWDIIDRFGLPHALFPPLRSSGARLGDLTAASAEDLGLRPGTPVALGGADTQCALLAGGALDPGDVMAVTGTTAPVQLVTGSSVRDPEGRLWSERHVVEPRGILESNAGAMGECVDWLARILYTDPATGEPVPEAAAALLAEAAESVPGAAGIHSTLGGEVMNARELAAPIGSFTFSYLTCHGDPQPRRHLARSTVEGMAYAVRANLDQLRDVGQHEPDLLRVGGGLTRSRAWIQILADVVGLPVLPTRSHEATALGGCLLAGVGAGVWPSAYEAGRAARVHDAARTPIQPEPGCAERYASLYADWRKLREERAQADRTAVGLVTPAILEASARAAKSAETTHRPRILVTADLDETSLERLRSLGDVEFSSYREAMRLLSGPSLVEALEGVEVFVTEVDLVDAGSLARLPSLRIVAACRGDAVNVDVEACAALGIAVLTTPGRNADAVADLVLGFLLMLCRKLRAADAFLREPGGEAGDMGRMGRAFTALRGHELWEKTVGLVGLGAVGAAVARRLRGFGARVLVYDPYLAPGRAARLGAQCVSLPELLRRSDFVSLHAPVTDETRGMIGARELATMKPGACLVNTARAALVDERALLQALESGHLGGAALDVFAVEPPAADHPLLARDDVVATPHVGGNTSEVAAHQGAIVAGDLERLLRGEAPLFAHDPEVARALDWQRERPQPDAARLEWLASRPAPAVSDLQKQDAASPIARQADEAAAAEAPPEIRDHMRRLLTRFVEGLESDEELARFARDQDVTLEFRISDLALGFHLRLRNGRVSAGLETPDDGVDVALRMRADVLDGMLTGRVNGMQAATRGELSFSGDTGKAMAFQQVQKQVSRHYRAARNEVGDPGDLASLPTPGEAAAGPRARPVAPGDVREEIVAVVGELYAQQVITATGGNVSARAADADELWITPSQLFKGDLRPEILVRLDLDGEPLDPGALAPSSERLMHCAVYRARPEARAVIHAHAPHATILANAGLPFLPISTEAAFFDDLPRVPFIMPGTRELADAIEAAMRSSWAVLMVNHGILVAGRSLRRAADMVEIVERTAEVILGCHAVGREPPTLPEDVVKTLREMGDLVA